MSDRIVILYRGGTDSGTGQRTQATPEEIAAEMNLDRAKSADAARLVAAAQPGAPGWRGRGQASSALYRKRTRCPAIAKHLRQDAAREDRRAARFADAREARILRLRFGLLNGRSHTLEKSARSSAYGATANRPDSKPSAAPPAPPRRSRHHLRRLLS